MKLAMRAWAGRLCGGLAIGALYGVLVGLIAGAFYLCLPMSLGSGVLSALMKLLVTLFVSAILGGVIGAAAIGLCGAALGLFAIGDVLHAELKSDGRARRRLSGASELPTELTPADVPHARGDEVASA